MNPQIKDPAWSIRLGVFLIFMFDSEDPAWSSLDFLSKSYNVFCYRFSYKPYLLMSLATNRAASRDTIRGDNATHFFRTVGTMMSSRSGMHWRPGAMICLFDCMCCLSFYCYVHLLFYVYCFYFLLISMFHLLYVKDDYLILQQLFQIRVNER